MLCLIANNYREAKSWAEGQLLSPEEWFYFSDVEEIARRNNFHVIVVGTCEDMRAYQFEKILSLAKQRGRIGR